MTARDIVTLTVIVILVGVAAILKIGPDVGGTVVSGEVTGKREAIEMPLDDTWRRVFEISYRYQPAGARFPATGHHPVDVSLYDRLRVGSPVSVRYRRLPVVGAVAGAESALAASSWLSRMPLQSEGTRQTIELAVAAAIAVAGMIAYGMRSRPLGLLSATAGAIFVSTVLLFGFFVFPLLFVAWRKNPGKGFGWVLAATLPFSLAALYYWIPGPVSMPAGPYGNATGVVRHVKTVDRIWASASTAGESERGQNIRHPFQMVDLEFVPAGATEPIHVLDRVDLGSVPGLTEGAIVPITYPRSDPRSGQLAAGTRRYRDQAFLYLLELTFGFAVVVAAALSALIWLDRKVLRLTARFVGLTILVALVGSACRSKPASSSVPTSSQTSPRAGSSPAGQSLSARSAPSTNAAYPKSVGSARTMQRSDMMNSRLHQRIQPLGR